MNYNEMLDYGFFLAEQQLEDARLNAYINNCMMLAEGGNIVREMTYIQEAIGQSVKNFFSKIVNVIKSVWSKFVETLNRFIKNTQEYLENYKDIILKKKAPDVTYTMYNYPEGLKIMVNAAIPQFNYEMMKPYLDGENQAKFLKQYAPFKDCLVPNSDATYPEQYKITFRSGRSKVDEKVQIDASTLNMKDIYDYCYNYQSIKDKLEKDIATIDKAAVDANNIILKRTKDESGQNIVPEPDLNATDEEQKVTNNSANMYYRYSLYFNELEATPNTGDTKTTTTTSNNNTSTTGTTFKSNNKNIQTASDNNKEQSDNALNTVTGDVDIITKQINVYFDSAKEFLGAKQTVFEEIFKEYMEIIKYHVRYYVGHQDKNKSAETDRTEQRGSNYKTQQGNQQNNNQQTQEGQPEKKTLYQRAKEKILGNNK